MTLVNLSRPRTPKALKITVKWELRAAPRALAPNPKFQEHDMANGRTATLHRMVLPDHTCPYGVRAKQMLEERGFEVDDQVLSSREEVEAFKDEHGLSTTPLIFIDGEQIGGASDLEDFLASEDANA
jgi:glutaredoxin